MIKETSRLAYHNYALPQAKTQYDLILKVMKEGETYTRRELHHLTGIETSTVSARVNHLLKPSVHKIIVTGTKRDPYTRVHVEALMRVTGEQMRLM
jgi:predicted HTH transcriptional regulator